ncbi:MAG: nucleotidyltransferase family protein [Planctomycetes bacterium]|nr:nucleotidyltransferase family protein [Planctomycetota bacterium]
MQSIHQLFVQPEDSICTVMKCIDRSGQGIALLVDEQDRFLATITDGDLRRAILAGAQLDSPVAVAVTRQQELRPSVTALVGTPREEQLQLMQQAGVRHLPLLQDGRVAELASLHESLVGLELPVQAVIMAGGFGKRLRPLTDSLPKPMLSIGGKPLMERTIESLQQAGVRKINITTHYLPETIQHYFGSGSRHGVQLTYVSEDEPLGTAGAIRLVQETEEPLLVMNGDILTRVDYRALLSFHEERAADLTVGSRQYEVELPYGVIEADDGVIRRLREKPKYSFLVNAGVYVLSPWARRYIPSGRPFHMTDLIEALLEQGRAVACFPIVEYWLDIGRHEDFLKAEQDLRELPWAA